MAKQKSGNSNKRSTRYSALPSRDHGRWRIRWVDLDGKRRSRSFPANAYQEAVAELERVKGETRAVKDGRKPQQKKVLTLKEFHEKYWRPNRTLSKRSPKDDESILRKHLLPAFGNLPLTYITTEKVEKFKGDLSEAKLKPKTISNILTLLGSILRYATELDFIFRLPKIKKPRLYQNDYQYLRTATEIRRFLNEAKKQEPGVYELFATAVYTGMRAGELLGLRWSDVDLKQRLISVKRSFDKPTKSGRLRYVPILDPLLPILKKWRLQNDNELVFPNAVGNMHTPNPRVIKFTFKEALEKAELAPIRFHDLRHSFASHWMLNGGDIFRLQKILGHADQAMVQRYAHLAPDAYQKDFGILGSKAPAGEKAEVVKIKKKAKS